MSDIVERLRSNQPLVICPFDRMSPEYWTTPNDQPCKFCGGLPEGPDKCTGADTRILGEAADEIERLRAERDRRTSNPADYRYWEGRYRDEKVDNERLSNERYQLALAICGGEDAPGYLGSLTVEIIVDVAASNRRSHTNDIDRLMAAEATCEKLAKALEPFVKDIENWTDENGWSDGWPSSDRIRYWFGPSDFRAAKDALAAYRNRDAE